MVWAQDPWWQHRLGHRRWVSFWWDAPGLCRSSIHMLGNYLPCKRGLEVTLAVEPYILAPIRKVDKTRWRFAVFIFEHSP